MKESKSKTTIRKLDAAKRQLETAIRLYFDYGDHISIHTLTGAAYSIIRDINEKRGGEMMIKDLGKLLNEEDKTIFQKHINRPENFLKHADKDPEASFNISPEWTEGLLCEASQRYCTLTQEQPPLLVLFLFWFFSHHPNFFDVALPSNLENIPDALLSDRRKFFLWLWPPPAALASVR